MRRMGTHPNGPADVLHPDGAVPLLQYVRVSCHSKQQVGSAMEQAADDLPMGENEQENPSLLGSSGDAQQDLPFLFKVLSVNTALSIQVRVWA